MINMKEVLGTDKHCEGIEIHKLSDLLIPKVNKSKDPLNHYWNNSARRLFIDVLAAEPGNFDKVKAIIEKSTVEELAALVNKPKSQFSKMVSDGDIKGAECVRAVLVGKIKGRA
jgi:hypothetical protein